MPLPFKRWENAKEFGAKLVFAEHRFYGASKPFPEDTDKCLNFLTTEQAMADFAELIDYVRRPPPTKHTHTHHNTTTTTTTNITPPPTHCNGPPRR